MLPTLRVARSGRNDTIGDFKKDASTKQSVATVHSYTEHGTEKGLMLEALLFVCDLSFVS